MAVLSSLWDGLSDHLIAEFYEVEASGADWVRKADGPSVRAPLSEASMEFDLNWQSPFEQAGPESKAPALMAMLQSGQLSPFVEAIVGKESGIAAKSKEFLSEFEGRTGVTKLNSTQVFNGMPPVKITCTALFRAWRSGATEVEAPVEQLFQWALPQELSKDGSVVARSINYAKGDGPGVVATLMPSLSPVKVAMTYKGRLYSPLVIESIGYPISSPVNSSGHFVQLAIPMTLATLTAIDKNDWTNAKINTL